jgi:multidrug efflux pump subunit AcrA (membrane-fusion protein)
MSIIKRKGTIGPARRFRPALVVAAVAVLGGIMVMGWRHAHDAVRPGSSTASVRYQCPMHPQIVRDRPGDCPICHMHLEKIEAPAAEPVPSAGATGVPGKAAFTLSAHRRQLIGVKTVRAMPRKLSRTVRLPGRVSNDGGVILAQLLEIDAGHVAAGMDAVVVGPEGQEVPADVTQVDDGLDTLTRSFAVTLQTKEKDAWLRAGVFCEVRVTRALGERLAIPADAVLNTGDQQVVFVALPGGRFEPRRITLGREGDELVEVRKGLTEGEEVVSAANFLIDSESRFRAALDQF